MPPSLGNTLIARPRVETILREALAFPITLMQAPLGSGKSALLTALARTRDDMTVFESQPWHRGNFIEDLVFAIRSLRPDFGRRTLGAQSSGATPDMLAHSFVSDLQHVPASLVIAIDNAEHLADDPGFTTFISLVSQSVPQHGHLLLSGRSLPSMSTATLLATSRAVMIPADALAFSEEELGHALRARGLAHDESAVEQLYLETRGWAAAVGLALQSTHARVLSSEELALEYLSEALVSKLGPALLGFLELVAVFERIDSAVVSRAHGYGDVEGQFTALARAGAPIVRERNGYTVHPLLRTLVLNRSNKAIASSDAHALAARAYAQAGRLPAALFHLLESADASTADLLLRRHGESLGRTGDHASIRAVLEL